MILKVDNVKKSYVKNEIVLKGISFDIREGEIFSVLGANGAGKTTLIKIMSKLLNPSSGNVMFLNKNINELGQNYYKSIGLVLEGNRNLYWYLTAYENIFYYGRLMGLTDNKIQERGISLLKYFGIYDDRDKKVGDFSRGMQQKVAIIIALLNNPKLLFLDEPTIGLDVISKRDLIKRLKLLVKDEKVTIILTSHEVDVIESLSDRVLILKEGKICFLDTLDQLRKLYSDDKYAFILSDNSDEELIRKNFNFISLENVKGSLEMDLAINSQADINNAISKLTSLNLEVRGFYKKQVELKDIIIDTLERNEI